MALALFAETRHTQHRCRRWCRSLSMLLIGEGIGEPFLYIKEQFFGVVRLIGDAGFAFFVVGIFKVFIFRF